MIRRALAISLAVALCGSTAFGAAIDVKNASFELPVQDPGGWTNDLPDWDGPEEAGNAFIEYIDGFSAEGVGHIGIQYGDEVSQNVGTVAPNTTYNLTVSVGKRNDGFTPAGNESRFGLYVGGDATAGGTLLADATYDASPLGDATFVDQALSFTTDGAASGDLYISLRTTGEGRAHFDNVRLEAVPEPASMGLALLGMLGVMGIRRR